MTKLLRIAESLILGVFFGFLPVLLCVATAGFVNVIFLEEKGIAYWALAGLVVGLIIDFIFVKRWVTKAYQMSSKALAGLYLFYSVIAIGMGMGIPLFNFALGTAAGVYSARKMHHLKAGRQQRERNAKKTSRFTAAAMAMVCCLMALWAIAGQVPGSRFETPWLSFTFTPLIFWTIALTGGVALVLLQYWLTLAAAKVTHKLQTLRVGPKIASGIMAVLAIIAVFGLFWIACTAYRIRRMHADEVSGGRDPSTPLKMKSRAKSWDDRFPLSKSAAYSAGLNI